MTDQELYDTYAKWTGQLHFYALRELGRHVDVEFFPAPAWELKVYSGRAQDAIMTGWYGTTVPSLKRPPGEARAAIKLPRPEDAPTIASLEQTFREICLAIARVLEIDLGKPQLPEGEQEHVRPEPARGDERTPGEPRVVKTRARRRLRPPR